MWAVWGSSTCSSDREFPSVVFWFPGIIVRTYNRKSQRASKGVGTFSLASERVIKHGESVRKVAKDYDVNFMTLYRFCKKAKQGDPATVGYKRPRLTFTSEQEKLLVNYILKASKIYYGLTPREVRLFAYEFAVANNIPFPPRWADNQMAGADWFSAFIKRHQTLSIRTPEARSLSRATSFNKTNVDNFFNHLSEVLDRYNFQCSDIYNVDETGVTTVQKPNRIVAQKGAKQVGAVTSGERGTLVTLLLAVNASGNALPPMFVFPRVNYRDHFINGGPPGCIGVAYPSGWMTESNFLIFIEHFIKVTKYTKEKPVLLTMDSHDSHVSLDLIDKCKENGIILLTFPPHCSHKLQPLDRSVYGPFKKYFNAGCDSWMKAHPGKPMTIYDLPGIVAEALPRATTTTNIQNGFRITGISPFNRHIFTDDEFMPCDVTDRPLEQTQQDNIPTITPTDEPEIQVEIPPQPGSSGTVSSETGFALLDQNSEPQPGTSGTTVTDEGVANDVGDTLLNQETVSSGNELPPGVVMSPEMLRPFRKASPRKPKVVTGKSGKLLS